MAVSQPAPSADSASSTGAVVNPHLNAEAPGQRIMKIKLENGSNVKTEAGAELTLNQGSPSPNKLATSLVGINLAELKHINGRPTIGLGDQMFYISLVDPANPPQNSGTSTISIADQEYHVVAVEPAPAPPVPKPVIAEQTQQDGERDGMADAPDTQVVVNPCPPLSKSDNLQNPSPGRHHLLNRQLQSPLTSLGLRVVSAEIGDAIMGFGKEMYKSIKDEPRRWLKFAVELKHVAIFNEAVVHVVGQWPDMVNRDTFGMLTPRTVALIQAKANEMRWNMLEANERLLVATLGVGHPQGESVRLELKVDESTTFDTWFIVQMWHDWYRHNVATARVARVPENYKDRDLNDVFDTIVKMGAVFRLLGKAGEAYLSKKEVHDNLKFLREKMTSRTEKGDDSRADMSGFLAWLDWEKHLKMMKDQAKEAVKHLMVNKSMLAPEEDGIRYLTCVTVDEDERPWDKD